MTVTRKEAVFTVLVTFEGDYIGADEVVDVTSGWIHAGLEDRDDLRGVVVVGHVLSESPLDEDGEHA